MKRYIYAFLALLAISCFGSATAQAQQHRRPVEPAGHSFCLNGLGSPELLAAKTERSLASDPSGNQVLQGCAANPRLFLEAFQLADPEAGLTMVSELPAYIRSLVPMDPRAGPNAEFETSCLKDSAAGVRSVDMACITRPIRRGETVYGNPRTRKLVILSSCANPGVAEANVIVVTANPCLRVDYPNLPTLPGHGRVVSVSIRMTVLDRDEISSRCHELDRPGEPPVFVYPAECPNEYVVVRNGRQVRVVCDWRRVEQAASDHLGYQVRVQNVSGSYVAHEPGTASWHLPQDVLDGIPTLCWDIVYEDGTRETVTIGVDRTDFVNRVATITEEHVRTLRYAGNR